MTQPNQDNVTIAPTAAPLSHGTGSAARTTRTPERRTLVFATVVVTLLVIAGLVFVALPRWVGPLKRASDEQTPVEVGEAQKTATAADEPQIVAPYRAVELERARQKAQVALGRFVELQLKLEDEMQVDSWGAEAYSAVKDRANDADKLFLNADYEQALTEYAGAVADLEAVVEQGRRVHDDAVEAGYRALAEGDPAAAKAAFDSALAIVPDSARAASGAERAAKLPKVLDYLREAERALLRDDLETANEYLGRAKSLDPATAGIDEQLAEVSARRAEIRYQALLSEGFGAMEEGRFEAAERAFNQVLKARPNDSVAQAGIQQNAAQRTLARINALHAEALTLEEQGRLREALARYETALKIDRSLQFALDGRQRTRNRVTILDRMRELIEDPGVLSSDAEFNKARELLGEARQELAAGAVFEDVVGEFAKTLDIAAAPVPLVIVSDNATEVMIYRIGVLGTFERHEVNLRPGNYTIVGSRDGCRDVRKEILLTPEMPPVAIRCEERI